MIINCNVISETGIIVIGNNIILDINNVRICVNMYYECSYVT